MNTQYQCFVINLEQAVERKKFISQQLDQLRLPYEIIPAVNGKELSEQEMMASYDRQKALSTGFHDLAPAEIGCALSHISVYRKMIENNIPYALILEDDALLSTDLPQVLADLPGKLNQLESHIVILSHVPRYQKHTIRALNNQFKLAKSYKSIGGAYGYFLTQAAAQAMLNYLYPVWSVADKWEYVDDDKIARIEALLPYAIGMSEHGNRSYVQAQENLAGKHRTFKYYLKKWFYKQCFRPLFVTPFWLARRQESTPLNNAIRFK